MLAWLLAAAGAQVHPTDPAPNPPADPALDPAVDPAALRAVLACIEELHLPDAKGRPLVEVTTGGWSRTGTGPRQPVTARGILVGDDGRRFRIVDVHFRPRGFERGAGGDPAFRTGYVPIDLDTAADEVLAREPGHGALGELFHGWVCARNGDSGRASRLFARVLLARRHREAGTADVVAAVRLEIGWQGFENALAAFAARERTHAELRQDLQRWLRAFPGHELRPQAERLCGDLLRAGAEAPPDAGEPERLVHALADAELHGYAIDDDWPVFVPAADPRSPVARLVALGTAAAPALLAALDDERPTRVVCAQPRIGASHVVRVRRVAVQVLGLIAGIPCTHVEPGAARPQLEQWWRDVRERGELAVLAARAAAGELAALRRMVDVAPERVAEHARAALPRLGSSWQRCELLRLAARAGGTGAQQLLAASLAADDLAERAVAAGLLLERGPAPAALRALERAFAGAAPAADGFDECGAVLARFGDAAAIGALAQRCAVLPHGIVRALGGRDPQEPTGAAAEAAREELLRALLAERREVAGNFGGTLDPRICDFAAAALAARWPERFAFAFGALRPDRDRLLLQIAGAQAGAQGGAPAPGDEPAPAGLEALLQRWRHESSAVARQRLLEGVQGLGALPPLRSLRAGATGERRAELDAACRRLGSTVRSVGPGAVLAALPERLRVPLRGLAGRPLDADALVAAMVAFVAEPPPGAGVLSIELGRAGGTDGIAVEIGFSRGGAAGPGGKAAACRTAVAVGSQALLGRFGSGLRTAVGRRDHFADFAAALRAACALPDGEALEARCRIELR